MEKVHIELKRVQTWLFAIPRLRAMVGANTLLGETLRVELRALLLEGHRSGHWRTVRPTGAFPAADDNDPLGLAAAQHRDEPERLRDDPARDAEHGIVARDGGHFEACFDHDKDADAFARAAAELLHRQLPELRFEITIEESAPEHDASGDGAAHAGTQRTLEKPPARFLSTELPVLAPCSWTGRGLASLFVEQGDDCDEVSLKAAARHAAAKRAEESAAVDHISLLMRSSGARRRMADSFEELADRRYLALIHADGNGVGKESNKRKGDAGRAAFHHANRVLMRRALRHALDHIDHDEAIPACRDLRTRQSRQPVSPMLPLMLGGDDLLMVCRADVALPFVTALCKKLDALQADRSDGEFRLTLGIGIAIATYSLPFHQLHEIAEELATSAKRKTRDVSAVDWAAYTASWTGQDLAEVRRRDWLRGPPTRRRLLSQRPLPVLGRDCREGELGSLEGLLAGAKVLAGAKELAGAPRSQLRYLVEQLGRGEQLAQLAFEELSPAARTALHDRLHVSEVWSEAKEGVLSTPLLDLIDVAEIPRLGARERSQGSVKSTAKEDHHG